jgi:Protein of unknown function (DUF429)
MQIIGCDFSSSPSKRKPIVMAISEQLEGKSSTSPRNLLRISLSKLEQLETLDAFSDWLERDASWIGGFDLPFGLPRELIETLQWPTDWHACMQHYASLSREEIRATFKAFCDARPVGGKFAHRAADLPAGSSPSMKWVNPPVAYMLHAGVPRLIAAGCHFPGLHSGNASKVALEAYPGLLAREIIGSRSYKSDMKPKQTPDRLIARKDIVTALEIGHTRLKLRLKLSNAQREQLIEDASGDSLDAAICMLQAAWAYEKHVDGKKNYGLPKFDALEGWIVSSQ